MGNTLTINNLHKFELAFVKGDRGTIRVKLIKVDAHTVKVSHLYYGGAEITIHLNLDWYSEWDSTYGSRGNDYNIVINWSMLLAMIAENEI